MTTALVTGASSGFGAVASEAFVVDEDPGTFRIRGDAEWTEAHVDLGHLGAGR